MTSEPKTRQESAYRQLRADILAGNKLPGARLAFGELCAQYSVSVGVIREVLSRLSEQGLVRSVPQRGFFVAELSREDLMDLTFARREIEMLALRHAMLLGDVHWESEVLASHHRLAALSVPGPESSPEAAQEWEEAHRTFHETLLSGCANTRLKEISNQLRASAELYRQWSLRLNGRGERDVATEHRELTEAVLARDTERALHLLTRHIDRTTEVLLQTESAL